MASADRGPHDFAGRLEIGVGHDDVEIRTFGREFAHRLEALRLVDVVGVEDGDELTGGPPRARINAAAAPRFS